MRALATRPAASSASDAPVTTPAAIAALFVNVGNDGNDVIEGGFGQDYVDGGPGDDIISGTQDADVVQDGPGNDRIDAVDGAIDRIDCGEGNDIVSVDPNDVIVGNCEDVRR